MTAPELIDAEGQLKLFDVGDPVPREEDLPEPEVQKPEIPDPTEPMQYVPVLTGATISECTLYRYLLWRRFQEERAGEKVVLFIPLNPSRADAVINDPTCTRMEGFARREKAALMLVCNLFAFRATYPKDMRRAANPYGPENNKTIYENVNQAHIVIPSWGCGGSYKNAGPKLLDELASVCPEKLYCFGRTKHGHPKHPLFLRGDEPLVPMFKSTEEDL